MKKKNKSIRFRSTSSYVSEKTSGGTPQRNTPIIGLSKERTFQDYMSDNSMYFFPEKDDWRNRVILSIYEWAYNEESLEMMQFCTEYKIPYTTLVDWRNAYEDIKKAWTEAKRIIASRRKLGAMKRKLDGHYAYKDMHLYDAEWKEVDKYHSDMKKAESGEQQKIGVVLPCYNSCCVKGEK